MSHMNVGGSTVLETHALWGHDFSDLFLVFDIRALFLLFSCLEAPWISLGACLSSTFPLRWLTLKFCIQGVQSRHSCPFLSPEGKLVKDETQSLGYRFQI